MPKRTDIHSVLIIGAGPIIIGQACEFDYSGTQACKALKEEGYRVVLVNSNPATIMTDPEFADRTYIEPITAEAVEKIIAREIAEIAAGRINDREIRRAKDSLKGRILLTMESTGARMNRLGRAILNDSEILSVERLEAEIEAVTSEGVAELASLLLAPERLSAAGIGPREDKFREALSRIDLDRKVAA